MLTVVIYSVTYMKLRKTKLPQLILPQVHSEEKVENLLVHQSQDILQHMFDPLGTVLFL